MSLKLKQKIKKSAKALSGLGFYFFPWAVLAQSKIEDGLRESGLESEFGSSGLLGANSVEELIVNIIQILLGLAAVIAIVFIIIGGYQYMTSAGNDEQAEKGKKTLLNSMIGLVIIVMSYVFVNVVVNLVQDSESFF